MENEVRTAIVGLGDRAASLIRAVLFNQKNRREGENILFAGHNVTEMRFVAAFDIDPRKVGLNLNEVTATSIDPRCLSTQDAPLQDIKVLRGLMLDLPGRALPPASTMQSKPVDVTTALRAARVELVVCYLPPATARAERFYARSAEEAEAKFLKTTPVFKAIPAG